MESFNNRRVLVTGAANGIGCGIVEELIRNNATVIALDKDELNLNRLKQKFQESIEIVICDLSDWKSTNETVKKSFPIDFLVNNAGIASIQPLNEITEHDYDSIFTINVKAVINITKTVTGDWIERNHRGVVVNLSSQASIAGLLNHALYCASKGAIDAFTRAIALELGPYNIRVNCVNPTVVMTELGRKVWSEPQLKEGMLSKIPLKRFAEIRDVVDVILFLLSDHSRMITGVCLPVDGGFTAC